MVLTMLKYEIKGFKWPEKWAVFLIVQGFCGVFIYNLNKFLFETLVKKNISLTIITYFDDYPCVGVSFVNLI